MVLFFKKYKKVQWILFSIALLIYVNTVPNKWAIDDSLIIHQNNFVKKGISGIPDIFCKDAFAGFYGKDVNAVTGGRYRPLTPALFAVQAELFASTKKDRNQNVEKDKAGFKVKDLSENTWFPHILHFFNILWYSLLCMLLYRTLLLLFKQTQETNHDKAYFLAFVTTLIYTVHPLHTEAVTNVKGLDEILTMLGSVATLYFVLQQYVTQQSGNSTNNRHKKHLVWVLVSFTLALFAKETAITFLAVIPMALWFFTKASLKDIFKLTLPLLLPVILFLGIRTAVLHQPNKGTIAEELMNDPFLMLDTTAQYEPIIPGSSVKKLMNPNANTFAKMPYTNELATNFYTYGVYLKLVIAPYPLTSDYYPRHIEIKSFTDASVVLSLCLHLFLLLWALFHIRKKNPLAFGILYYFVTFSIVSNLFFSIGTNMAERFMFMPSLGFCFIIAYLMHTVCVKWSTNALQPNFNKVYLGLVVLISVYAVITVNRNFDWKDNYTLFSKDILVSKNSSKINTALAAELINKAIALKSEKEKEIEDWNLEDKKNALQECQLESNELVEKALPLLNKALEIHPLSNAAWLQMANGQHFLGENEANTPDVNLKYLQTALAAYDLAYYYKAAGMATIINDYKAICLMDLGKLMGQKFGDISSAIANLEKAKALNPKNAEVFLLLGTAYSMINDYEKSISNTEKSLALRPKDRDTKQNLAVAYQQYAFANKAKRNLLPRAEKLLLEVYSEEKKLADNDVTKNEAMIRTLDLIYRNYLIQGKVDMADEYKQQVLKLNPNAYSN